MKNKLSSIFKKSVISFSLSAILINSGLSYAETFIKEEYLQKLKRDVITIDKVKNLEIKNNDEIEELILLGDFYLYNEKYRNTFKSFDYYKRATIKGSEYAKMMLGYFTYKGYGTDPNVYKGEFLLRDVKRPYDKNAKFLLALSFYNDKQYDKSIDLFLNIKDTLSYKYLTTMLIEKDRTSEAIPYLEWLSYTENDRVGKRILGELYLTREHLNEDEAIKLLTSSAEDGDDIAQYNLGMYYSRGTENTIADMKEATRWFLMSSQHDNAFAIKELINIWSINQTKNNIYGLNNDPYLIKELDDIFVKMHLND